MTQMDLLNIIIYFNIQIIINRTLFLICSNISDKYRNIIFNNG